MQCQFGAPVRPMPCLQLGAAKVDLVANNLEPSAPRL